MMWGLRKFTNETFKKNLQDDQRPGIRFGYSAERIGCLRRVLHQNFDLMLGISVKFQVAMLQVVVLMNLGATLEALP